MEFLCFFARLYFLWNNFFLFFWRGRITIDLYFFISPLSISVAAAEVNIMNFKFWKMVYKDKKNIAN